MHGYYIIFPSESQRWEASYNLAKHAHKRKGAKMTVGKVSLDKLSSHQEWIATWPCVLRVIQN